MATIQKELQKIADKSGVPLNKLGGGLWGWIVQSDRKEEYLCIGAADGKFGYDLFNKFVLVKSEFIEKEHPTFDEMYAYFTNLIKEYATWILERKCCNIQ